MPQGSVSRRTPACGPAEDGADERRSQCRSIWIQARLRRSRTRDDTNQEGVKVPAQALRTDTRERARRSRIWPRRQLFGHRLQAYHRVAAEPLGRDRGTDQGTPGRPTFRGSIRGGKDWDQGPGPQEARRRWSRGTGSGDAFRSVRSEPAKGHEEMYCRGWNKRSGSTSKRTLLSYQIPVHRFAARQRAACGAEASWSVALFRCGRCDAARARDRR